MYDYMYMNMYILIRRQLAYEMADQDLHHFLLEVSDRGLFYLQKTSQDVIRAEWVACLMFTQLNNVQGTPRSTYCFVFFNNTKLELLKSVQILLL